MVINVAREKIVRASVEFHGDIYRGIDIETAYKNLRLRMKYGAIGWCGMSFQDDY